MHGLSLRFPALRDAAVQASAPLRQWLDANPKTRNRFLGLGLVVGVHVLAVAILLGELQTVAPDSSASEMVMTLSPLAAPALSSFTPDLQALPPAPIEVPVPAIEIAGEDAPNAIASAVGDTSVIAPRPDPAHPNDVPDGGEAGRAAQVVLRILVLEDGTVGDDTVAQSSGTLTLDQLALAFAKANWRYLPATLAGRAIQAWTTVIVRFR